MFKDELLSKVSSDYCLKSIFSYIKYNKLLKLVKHSKKLQKKLDLKIQNYHQKLNYICIHKEYSENHRGCCQEELDKYTKYLSITCFLGLISLYIFIYGIYLNNTFSSNNEKEINNNDKKYFNIIKAMNKILFLNFAYNFITFIIFICLSKLIYYKKSTLITINCINILFTIVYIIKFIFLFKVKIGFLFGDFFLIIFSIIYNITILYISEKYWYNIDDNFSLISLIKFKDIFIHSFVLPDDFLYMNKQQRRSFILNNQHNLKYSMTYKEIQIIKLINDFRINNNLPKLVFDEKDYLFDFFFDDYNGNPEIILYPYRNIYKLSFRKYLFKYKVNEFENNLKNNNEYIIDILLIEDLNKIFIIKQRNIEYIFIYESDIINPNLYEEINYEVNENNDNFYEDPFFRTYTTYIKEDD